jgi:hypothetical protein
MELNYVNPLLVESCSLHTRYFIHYNLYFNHFIIYCSTLLKLQYIALLVSVVSFANIPTGVVSASTDEVYCYDNDVGGPFCFETREACAIEYVHDLTADSQCYKQPK